MAAGSRSRSCDRGECSAAHPDNHRVMAWPLTFIINIQTGRVEPWIEEIHFLPHFQHVSCFVTHLPLPVTLGVLPGLCIFLDSDAIVFGFFSICRICGRKPFHAQVTLHWECRNDQLVAKLSNKFVYSESKEGTKGKQTSLWSLSPLCFNLMSGHYFRFTSAFTRFIFTSFRFTCACLCLVHLSLVPSPLHQIVKLYKGLSKSPGWPVRPGRSNMLQEPTLQ